MALKMQTYDKPTDTWSDVVSVVQEVVVTSGYQVLTVKLDPVGPPVIPIQLRATTDVQSFKTLTKIP